MIPIQDIVNNPMVTITLNTGNGVILAATPVRDMLKLMTCKTSSEFSTVGSNLPSSDVVCRKGNKTALIEFNNTEATIHYNGKLIYKEVFKLLSYREVLEEIMPLGFTLKLESYNRCQNITKVIQFVKDNCNPSLYEKEIDYVLDNAHDIEDVTAPLYLNAKYGTFKYLKQIAFK